MCEHVRGAHDPRRARVGVDATTNGVNDAGPSGKARVLTRRMMTRALHALATMNRAIVASKTNIMDVSERSRSRIVSSAWTRTRYGPSLDDEFVDAE